MLGYLKAEVLRASLANFNIYGLWQGLPDWSLLKARATSEGYHPSLSHQSSSYCIYVNDLGKNSHCL